MPLPEIMEHYVTVFDSKFVLAGIALHESLMRHCRPFTLWVVGLDAEVVDQLERLALPDVKVIPLPQIESAALLGVKPGRTRGEYSWTLTPFLPGAVMERAPEASRVTYLDADLYFFGSAEPLFLELDESGKDVLITPHAYAPDYDHSARSGRFCVQFVVFRNTDAGRSVLKWWQDRCLEWCFARYENGRFGDQMYLDAWPQLFGDRVHILQQTRRTLAPWNVDYMTLNEAAKPTFYHFQGFRILSLRRVKLYHGYRVASRNRWIYDEYLRAIVRAAKQILDIGGVVPVMPEHAQRFRVLKYCLMWIGGFIRFSSLSNSVAERRGN